MTHSSIPRLLACLIASFSILHAAEFERLFNGKDLSGWKGLPENWSVRDQMIVGSSVDQPIEANTFLIWQNGEVENFILKAKVRVEGQNNSGLQYRSEIVNEAGFALKGHQCDMHPKNEYLGMLYGEKTPYGIIAQRGQKVTITKDKEKKVTGAVRGKDTAFHLSEWNEFTIIAAGKRVIHQVNGVNIIDVTDHSGVLRLKGLLGFQLHKGAEMTVYAKDVYLKKLSLEEAKKAQSVAIGGAQKKKKKAQEQNGAVEALRVTDGFHIDKLYTVPKETQGSWVAMTKDAKGRLIVSDQGDKGLFRIDVSNGDEIVVEKIPVSLSDAQGLLWHKDSLYVHLNGKGLFQVRDTNGDDELDEIVELPGAKGRGEHGNHAVIVSGDGENIFVDAGNHTPLPKEIAGSAVTSWQEDLLLPRQWDANGHARGLLAPGGWVCRVTPDGTSYWVHAIGFRNQYDLTLNKFGDLFAYDADMEWDVGAPWYRPTRLCHTVSGADFGWRSGTGKWPSYYEDSLPPIVDLGPGSPTGVVSGMGAKFPAAYQDATFLLDWTFGTIYAVHTTPQGASYQGEAEVFVSGAPLPLTDAVIGDDGALYFTTGGRGTQSALYRVTYEGKESTAPSTSVLPPAAKKAQALRCHLEGYHGRKDSNAVEDAWPHLKSPDRFLRHAARVAIESQPIEQWVKRAFEETNPQTRITAAVAIARCGKKELRARQISSLLTLSPESLEEGQFLGLLRAYALTFIRLGAPEDSEKELIISQLDPHLPAKNKDINTELVRVLVYLDAPGVIEKTLALIANRSAPKAPDWGALIKRNQRYGGAIRKMLDSPPPSHEIGLAFMLRNVRYGWSIPQRRAYIEFINAAAKFPGGRSYAGFLTNLRTDSLKNASEGERAALSDLTGETLSPKLGFTVTPPKGPGRTWSVASALEQTRTLKGSSFEAGRNLFHASSCAACHRFDGVGGAIGPDLTTARNKFSHQDLLEAIIEPSKVISDQYGSSTVTLHNGKTATGIVVEQGDIVEVYTSDHKVPPTVFNFSDVKSIDAVPVSQMPPGLINALSPDELRDLLAFLLSRGNPNDPIFQN